MVLSSRAEPPSGGTLLSSVPWIKPWRLAGCMCLHCDPLSNLISSVPIGSDLLCVLSECDARTTLWPLVASSKRAPPGVCPTATEHESISVQGYVAAPSSVGVCLFVSKTPDMFVSSPAPHGFLTELPSWGLWEIGALFSGICCSSCSLYQRIKCQGVDKPFLNVRYSSHSSFSLCTRWNMRGVTSCWCMFTLQHDNLHLQFEVLFGSVWSLYSHCPHKHMHTVNTNTWCHVGCFKDGHLKVVMV